MEPQNLLVYHDLCVELLKDSYSSQRKLRAFILSGKEPMTAFLEIAKTISHISFNHSEFVVHFDHKDIQECRQSIFGSSKTVEKRLLFNQAKSVVLYFDRINDAYFNNFLDCLQECTNLEKIFIGYQHPKGPTNKVDRYLTKIDETIIPKLRQKPEFFHLDGSDFWLRYENSSDSFEDLGAEVEKTLKICDIESRENLQTVKDSEQLIQAPDPLELEHQHLDSKKGKKTRVKVQPPNRKIYTSHDVIVSADGKTTRVLIFYPYCLWKLNTSIKSEKIIIDINVELIESFVERVTRLCLFKETTHLTFKFTNLVASSDEFTNQVSYILDTIRGVFPLLEELTIEPRTFHYEHLLQMLPNQEGFRPSADDFHNPVLQLQDLFMDHGEAYKITVLLQYEYRMILARDEGIFEDYYYHLASGFLEYDHDYVNDNKFKISKIFNSTKLRIDVENWFSKFMM